jgi:dolichyl-phosphate beta-glucosyltransferase
MAKEKHIPPEEAYQVTDAEVFMTLVVPAYNEEERLSGMLEEAVEYLEEQYGHHGTRSKSSTNGSLQASGQQGDPHRGWEIILVSDGSRDKTVKTALEFARTHQLNKPAPTPKGPWNSNAKPTNILPGTIRVLQLEKNRGKGGAVTHGMRHARGTYVVFADADGASKFSDLGKLVVGCEKAKDKLGRAVGVGSRAHMVGTEAVVKVSCIHTTFPQSELTWRPEVHAAKHTDARFPPLHLAAYHPPDLFDPGYSMWIQALHSAVVAVYHSLYALRGLDFRR